MDSTLFLCSKHKKKKREENIVTLLRKLISMNSVYATLWSE